MMNLSNENAFGSATRIVAGDDGTNYDNVAVALHWTTAVLVVGQFALAESWDWFQPDTRESLQSLHVSLGILLAAVIVARLIWRWIPGHQRSSIAQGWMATASKGVHYLLYGLLVAQAALGFTVGWSSGHPIHFFGIPIPGPFAALSRPMRHQIREIHSWVGWTIIIVAFAHALAALYHHYVLKDRVLLRMLPGGLGRVR
jgi:cytochrome b561